MAVGKAASGNDVDSEWLLSGESVPRVAPGEGGAGIGTAVPVCATAESPQMLNINNNKYKCLYEW